MRFIGNKENLIEQIYDVFQAKDISGNVFFDFFSGTSNVAKFYKKKNYQVISSDLLYFSYCLQRAYIVNNEQPKFENLLGKIPDRTGKLFTFPLEIVVDFLNSLEGREGFIFQNYTPAGTKNLPQPRMFLIPENGKKIDAIRQQIEIWKTENLITENEYFILLACLIESVPFYANISGVYAAFQKTWDPRALKTFRLRTIEIIENEKENFSFNADSVSLINEISCDLLYLDPPYNHRQYAPNYHLLETIARYDNPEIKGVAGLRNYENQKSVFCNPSTALLELNKIAERAKYKYLILSYNSEGTMPQERIIKTLQSYGELMVIEFDNLRFKSNSNGEAKFKKLIKEQLYILSRPKIA